MSGPDWVGMDGKRDVGPIRGGGRRKSGPARTFKLLSSANGGERWAVT